MFAPSLRRQLQEALEMLISRAQEKDFLHPILAQPPIVAPGISITPHRGRPLTETGNGRNNIYLDRWDEQRVHSGRLFCLCYVLEGEADWRIGVTSSMAAQLSEPYTGFDYLVLALPRGSFILIPPGVPYSRSDVHWERPHPEQACSRIFWMQVSTSGVFCHICRTDHGVHVSDHALFVRDASLEPLFELLNLELLEREAQFEMVAHTQLMALLLRVRRALANDRAFERDAEWAARPDAREAVAPLNTEAVKRACGFIESHLHEPFTVADVAAYVYMSPSHLNRLFRSELGSTIMKYATTRRLENAKALLIGSHLPVHQIGRMVGYSNSAHFTQVFSQQFRISPLEYRRGQRSD